MDKKLLKKLAKGVVDYSLGVKENKKVFIIAWNGSQPLVKMLCEEIVNKGSKPFVVISDDSVDASIIRECPDAYKEHWEMYRTQMGKCDYFINIRAMDEATLAEAGENAGAKLLHMRTNYAVLTDASPEKPWVLMTYPTPAIAKLFNKSIKEMEDFWLFATGFDYASMDAVIAPLVKMMAEVDKVEIKGNGCDLSFSCKGIGAVECTGKRNLPDGEVYTSPIKDSINGVMKYSMMTPQSGHIFTGVTFTFKDGKIIEATCDGGEDKIKALNAILDTDAGSRYIGEFAIGINPFIVNAVGNILFDEKMMGSIHLTPGDAYANAADNGNRSKNHWDIVHSQQKEHGGGEIWFDGVLIRKDGIFVVEELKKLNPDMLSK